MNFCDQLRRALFVAFIFVGVSFGSRTLAQDKSTYRSDVDDLLTVERVSVLPFSDNVQGIYSRPLENHLIQLIDKMHRWNYVPSNQSGPVVSPDELEESPQKAKQVSQGLECDGFFVTRISKGPNGITIHMSFFLTKDGKLLSQAILKDFKQFNLEELKEQLQRLLSEVVQRLPYSGRVLSRELNRVTVNLGLRDGLQVGQMLSVVQIVQMERHPKFNFLIRTEKEIFGKIKILKVDETLSFGVVVMEKEKTAIQKNAKIGPLDFVAYGNGGSLSLSPSTDDLLAKREDGPIAFGKDAQAWKPQAPPTFGQIGGRFGLSRVAENTQLSDAGGVTGADSAAPSLFLEGEIWITQEWTFHAQLQQSIVTVNNGYSGSKPTKLSQSLSAYEAGFGYMWRFGPHVWSSQIEPFLSYFTHRLYTDSSSPLAFTTMEFNGFKFGLRGSAPITPTGDYGVGGQFGVALRPGLTETPVSSASSSTNSVVQFGLLGYKRMGERLKLQGNLDFEMYSASFSGRGTRSETATSASQKFTTLSAGLYYMF